MTIGLSTYAFFWQWHPTAVRPLDLAAMITKTAGWGVELFQICDYPAIEAYDADQLERWPSTPEPRGSGWSWAPGGWARTTCTAIWTWPARSTSRWCAAW